MRNLSKEAAAMAIRQLATQNPALGDKMTRQNLTPQEKQQVMRILMMLGEFYEKQLVHDITHGQN